MRERPPETDDLERSLLFHNTVDGASTRVHPLKVGPRRKMYRCLGRSLLISRMILRSTPSVPKYMPLILWALSSNDCG